MKNKRLNLICGAVGAVILIATIWLFHPNDLGLEGSDVLLGDRPDLEALRANTQAAAEVFLTQHKAQLAGESGRKYAFALDYSKSSPLLSS
jgi:hypothetical protein